MKTSTIGAFVKIDAGGQWHATIPKKGNRWIDMPGAAMQKLEDSVRRQYTDDVSIDSDEATLEQAVGDLPIVRKAIEDKLATGDEASVASAQDDAQEVLDSFPWEDWEDNSEDPRDIQESREALQAFVDVEPGDFLELAQAGGETGDVAEEGLPGDFNPIETDPKSLTDAQLQQAIGVAEAQMNAMPSAVSEMGKIWGPYFQEQYDRGLAGDVEVEGAPEVVDESDEVAELDAEAEADDADDQPAGESLEGARYADLTDENLDALYRRYHDDGGNTNNEDYARFLADEMQNIAREKARRAKEVAL